MADALIDTIGVNTKFSFGRDFSPNPAQGEQLVLMLGVRHLRDYPDSYTNDLFNRAGIDTIVGMDIDSRPSDVSAMIINHPEVRGVEPNNEYDAFHAKDHDWIARITAEQKMIDRTVRADSRLRNQALVIGPSTASTYSAAKIGDLSTYMDIGNMHGGQCDFNPGTSTRDNHIESFISRMRAMDGSRQIWMSEIGGVMDNQGAGCYMPDDIGAKYKPRQFAYLFNEQATQGVMREYIYDFQDDNLHGEFSHQGLVTYDGSPKPEYYALQSMIALLSDKGSPFSTTPLSFKLSGNTANVDHTLLQKRDGSHWLLLWIEASDWDHDSKTRIRVPSQNVTLTAPGRTKADVYTYNSSFGLDRGAYSLNGGSLKLTLTDAITFVRL